MTAGSRPREDKRMTTGAEPARAPAPAIDIQVQSPLWDAQPWPMQTVRARDRRRGGRRWRRRAAR